MPNTIWSKLNSLQLGRYAEYYAKMEFASYGFEIYTSELDDHGIDFIAKTKSGVPCKKK
jgi:predicted GNAT family N-acyltransferase